jgi:hypothetical protein
MLASDLLAMVSGRRFGGRDTMGRAGGELADSVSPQADGANQRLSPRLHH